MMKIYEAKNHLLIYADGIEPIKHSHMATHIIVSLGGMIDVTIENRSYSCKGIAIPAGAGHSVIANGNKLLVLLYDCTTAVAGHIKADQVISPAACDRIARVYDLFEQLDVSNIYNQFEQSVLQEFGIMESFGNVTDARILFAMEYIRENLSDNILCKTVADKVCLSKSRFSHLFSKQLGMTFAAYLVYQRLMYVYSKVISGVSITEAALEAGFSSSSHFSDVSRRVFGLSARKIMKNASFIKVQ